MISGGFLPPEFSYKLASLGLLDEMSGARLAQKYVIGVADEG